MSGPQASDTEIGKWLAGLGLERYAEVFVANDIDVDILEDLDESDLTTLGVTMGHRKRLLRALGSTKRPTQTDPTRSARSGPQADEAERRHLTVMFCDLVGSTQLATQFDPEDLRELIRSYQSVCNTIIARFDGYVARYMGDGIMVYFGYPHAHEDDAARAIRAGLEMVSAIPESDAHLALNLNVTLHARIGIATGMVVVGDIIGEDVSEERAVVGETPNLAARVESFAQPDTVAIAHNTRVLAGNSFRYRDLGARTMKGFPEAMRVYQVTGEEAVDPLDAHGAAVAPLFGREHEVATLQQEWQFAKSGEGRVVLLSGEAGIGKSRVLRSLQKHIDNQDARRIRYQCSPYHSNTTLYPVVSLLAKQSGFNESDSRDTKFKKLSEVLTNWGDECAVLLPQIARCLSLDSDPGASHATSNPEREQERTCEALCDLIEGMSAQTPLLIAFEDVHWVDPTSWSYLERLIERIRNLSVMIIVTYRTEFKPSLQIGGHVRSITLERLNLDDAAGIVSSVTGGVSLPKEVMTQILEKTDGIPLFVEELTKMVVESGLLSLREDSYELLRPLPPLAIPVTLQDSLMARLDRLAPIKEVAQIGATIGREFKYDLLREVTLLEEQELRRALLQLADAELIFRRGTPPHATYTFKHALVQDAAYSSMLRNKRRLLHARVAEVLESEFPERIRFEPELMAQHCAKGGLEHKAAPYWRDAAKLVLSRSAPSEALSHIDKGLEATAALPDDSVSKHASELDLLTLRAWACIAVYGYNARETANALESARALCREDEDAPQLFSILFGQWSYHLLNAKVDVAYDTAELLLDVSQSCDAQHIASAHRVLGTSAFWRGDFSLALVNLERSLELFAPDTSVQVGTTDMFDTHVLGLDFLALSLIPSGQLAQARHHNQHTREEAQQASNLVTRAIVLQHTCLFYQLCGDANAVRDNATLLTQLAHEQHFPFWVAHSAYFIAWANAATVQPTDTHIQEMRDALQSVTDTGSALFLPYYSALLGEQLSRFGIPTEALKHFDNAIGLSEDTGERWFSAELHRLKGEHLMQSSPVDAADCLRRAMSVATTQNATLWRIRAALSLCDINAIDSVERGEIKATVASLYAPLAGQLHAADDDKVAALLRDDAGDP